MPSRRFLRLPPERRAQILAVARRHLAAHGPEAASYNRIIAEAGISKTSAYLYFDGKDDLVESVQGDVLHRLGEVLGPWSPADSPTHFWRALKEGAARLQRHLVAHPDDLGVLDATGLPEDEAAAQEAWLASLLRDGRRLGVVRADVPLSLLAGATRAVLQLADAQAVASLQRGQAPRLAPVWRLLEGLWTAAPGGNRER